MELKSWFKATSLPIVPSPSLRCIVMLPGEIISDWIVRNKRERRLLTRIRYANVYDTDLGDGTNTAPVGTLTPSSMPYSYTLLGSANVIASVVGNAGATLSI